MTTKDDLLRPPEPLRREYDRARFESGNEALDAYLKQRAFQDAERGIAFPYGIVDQSLAVIGYYTLTSTSIEIGALPPRLALKLPKHGVLGGVLVGRLAVDKRHRGRGIGSLLVAHALQQSFSENPAAAVAVIVDAWDEAAARFYRKLGFVAFPESERRLFIPGASLRRYVG